MKKIYIFTAIVSLVSAVVLAGPSAVFAQYSYAPAYTYVTPYTTSYVPTYGNVGQCTRLTYGLYKGLSDANTGGQVSLLQSFLISQGKLIPNAIKGYFGSLTYQGVVQYQLTHGLPVNGTVDAATRASIQTVSCGNNYSYNGGYDYGYNYNYNYNYNRTPIITSLGQTSGAVGSSVTIYGSGFDLLNNTVNFDGIKLTGIPSYNGTAIAFVVPQVYSPTYNTYSTYGNYSGYNYNYQNCVYPYSNCNTNGSAANVTVTNSRGTSNAMIFTVTFGNTNCSGNYYGSNCYNRPISVSDVSGPTTLTAGSYGTWSVTLYNPNSNYVHIGAKWGDENTYNRGYASAQPDQTSYAQGSQTFTFTHTYETSGYYTVVFTATDNQGAQASVSATVNVSGNSYQSRPSISYLSPSSGRVGTSVAIYGSGFSSYGNTVRFGNGGATNLSSINNGTVLYYTIPYSVSPCDVASGTVCPMYAQAITPGTYPISVSNAYGQSSTVNFTVTY